MARHAVVIQSGSGRKVGFFGSESHMRAHVQTKVGASIIGCASMCWCGGAYERGEISWSGEAV